MTTTDRRRAGGTDGTGGADRVGAERVEVRSVESSADLDAVLALRRSVFGEEQGLAGTAVADADDARSLIALAVIAGSGGERPVGTGRLTLGPFGAQITWVATLAEDRRRGVGGAVMRFLLAAADTAGVPAVSLNAQDHALAFYRRLGFVPYNNPFEVKGIVHQAMTRRRPVSPLDLPAG